MLRHTAGPAQPNCCGHSTTSRFALRLLQMAWFGLALCALTPALAGTWTQTGALHEPRTSASIAMLPNGLVLVAGGANNTGVLASAELYDPATGTFTVTGTMTTSRQGATAATLTNGKVLIAGGSNGSGSVATAEIYDAANGTFSATGSLAEARTGATATLLADGRVLMAGGMSSVGTALGSAELYDAGGGQFVSTGSLQTTRYAATATLLPDGQVLIAGGHTTSFSSNSIDSTEIYDPAAGMFSPGVSLTAARESATATLLANGKVLIAGGQRNNAQVLTAAELYDPVGATSIATGAMTQARYGAIAALLPSGDVLVAGGYGVIGGKNGFVASAETYNTATAMFSSAGNMANPRNGASATLLPNAQVFVVGGANSSGYQLQAEIYDAASGTFTATGSLPVGCQAPISAPLPDGRVLVLGCNDNRVQLFDPATGSFTTTTTTGTSRALGTLTLLGNGRVLAVGGNSNTAEEYDSIAATFTSAGSMLSRRALHTATLLADGGVLIAGGVDIINGLNPLPSTEYYSPTTRAFTPYATLLTARFQAMATLLRNGKVLVAGGDVGSTMGTATAAAELLDLALNHFSSTGSLSTARYAATATLLPDGKVLIAGGTTGFANLASAELYDPAIGAFSATGNMATARSSATATLLQNGKVLIAGGLNQFFSTVSSAELYDPATGLFSATGTMTSKREHAAATLLLNGKVLVVAGYIDSSNNVLQSAELYDAGVGFSDARRAQIDEFALTARTQPLALNIAGNGFRASTEQTTGALLGSEASSGSSQSAATNFPLLQLRRVDNDQQFFISLDSTKPWADSSFVTSTLASLPLGYYRATLYVNAIPSQARQFSVAPRLEITIVGGDQQTATVNTPFAQPLQAIVTDTADNPVQSVTVYFSCSPASDGACIDARNPLTSDAHGMVSGLVTANTKSGSYTTLLSATSDDVAATFHLNNIPGPATNLSVTGSLSQSTQVNTAFATALQLKVTDTYNNPVPGALVTFTDPASGASAGLSSTSATTDSNGVVAVNATANTVAGSYQVNASASALSGHFSLTNTAAPAAVIAARNGPAFNGTAGLALATTPAVVVSDSFGNPIAGAAVTFATVGSSGSITDENPITDSAGVATAGSWTLAADPGTNALQASAAGLSGSPVQFTATGSASVDVAVTMTNNRGFVQFGRTLDYVIVLTAAGPSNAHNVQVTDLLPAQLDAANAHWICIPAIGATCAANGNGNLVDQSADIATGGSVTFVLSATVLNDQRISADTITNTASVHVDGDTDTGNNALTVTTEAVIFRNAFEAGGDGSH